MASPLDLNDVQGDVLAGLPKKSEICFFFQIDDARVPEFRTQLTKFVPQVTTTVQVNDDIQRILQNKKSAAERNAAPELLEMSGVNIAFSYKGLVKIGVQDDIGDSAFNGGMLADAKNLDDKATSPSGTFDPDWIPEFKQDIHGLILITGNCSAIVNRKLAEIKEIFQVGEEYAAIHEVLSLVGDVRPGDEAGHEHFGFQDGISQPAVKDVDTSPLPGQQTVRQGIILLGREGDATKRPSWALDGSFLCFRYLLQLVPEFNLFLKQHAIPIPDPSAPPDLGSELLGARLVGRWKSGAPIDLTPLGDDPTLGADPSRNNNFRYDQDPLSQTRCPFAAHTRKTNPRADLDFVPAGSPLALENRRIIRRGIPFGPEVYPEEAASNTTTEKRGLLFVAYQSNITSGFQFIQKNWANNAHFPPKPPPPAHPAVPPPGPDAIIGQVLDSNNEPATRAVSGTNPSDPSAELLSQSEQWVVPKGGEYFFSPSIPALKNTFALAA